MTVEDAKRHFASYDLIMSDESRKAVDVLLAAFDAREEDSQLLDAFDNACRQIDLRFTEEPQKCYRWQVEIWGNSVNRPKVRDALRKTFGPLLEPGNGR